MTLTRLEDGSAPDAQELRHLGRRLDTVIVRWLGGMRRPGRPAEREHLVTLGRDFAARAQSMSGLALRELLRPCIERAHVDRNERIPRLAIRGVPYASPFLLLSIPPGRELPVAPPDSAESDSDCLPERSPS